MNVDSEEKLIFPLLNASDTVKYYMTIDKVFDVLHDVHLRVGHGGRDKMYHEGEPAI